MGPFRRHEPYAETVSPRLPRVIRPLLAMSAQLWLGVAMLAAQGPVDGAIHGVVTTSTGRAVGGAPVVIHSTESTEDRTETTRPDGTFLVIALPVGEYEISVGALRQQAMPVSVSLGETVEVTLRLGSSAAIRPSPELPREPDPDENGDGLTSARGLETTQNGA